MLSNKTSFTCDMIIINFKNTAANIETVYVCCSYRIK